MITREFNLYLHAGHSIPLVINVNQYDRGEQWLFTLFNADGTQYVPSSGAIVGIKSDNLGIINSGTVDSQGRVVISETQQMTAAVGKAVFELLIDDQTHGTANFIVLVEPKPGDNADLSESDYSLFQQAIDGTSATAIAEGVADWMDENLTPTTPVVDASLTVQGAAADAKKTGDEISALKSQIEQSSGLTSAIKSALLQLAQKVAYIDDDGQTYYDDLYDALYPPIVVTAITLSANSLSFGTLNSTQQLTATTTPTGGAVTWSSSDTSVATVSTTGLVTAIGYGNATITATSGSVSATCSVVIAQATLSSISAVYTQSGTVFDTDTLDDLKDDLVVTAHWSNGTTSTLAESDYTLSGNLNQSQSTITVTYGGQSTTFTVNVAVPVFDYLASRDGLLSEFSGITKFTNNDSNWNERMSEGTNLRIEGTGTGADYLQFKIGENPTTGKWRLRTKFELYSVTGTVPSGYRPQLSNGSNGMRVGFSAGGDVKAYEGPTSSTATNIGQITTGFVWHDMELYLDTSEPIQRVTIDGNVLLESASLASGFANNSVFFTDKCIVFVKYIKLYNQ